MDDDLITAGTVLSPVWLTELILDDKNDDVFTLEKDKTRLFLCLSTTDLNSVFLLLDKWSYQD